MKPHRNVESIFKTEAELNERIKSEKTVNAIDALKDNIKLDKLDYQEANQDLSEANILKEELEQERSLRNNLENEFENEIEELQLLLDESEKERQELMKELKVSLKSVASADLQKETEEELKKGDPENAKDIIERFRHNSKGVQKDST